MNTQGENAKLKEFLLGIESEADAEEIGVRLIADRGFAEKMSFAEEELVEEFLDDELTADEKELFYKNFLTTPARKELLDETVLLRDYARRNLAEPLPSSPDEKKTVGFLDGLKSFLALNLRPVAAVLLVLVIAGIAWRVFLYDDGLTEIERTSNVYNAKDLNIPALVDDLTKVNLVPGTFRDTDSATKLNAANATDPVLFRLALPAGTKPDALFDLEVTRGGQTVFRQTNLRVYQNPNGQELKVALPKSIFVKGAYQIKLNTGATYGLTVE